MHTLHQMILSGDLEGPAAMHVKVDVEPEESWSWDDIGDWFGEILDAPERIDCESCGGDGGHYDDADDWHDCPDCDGDGDIPDPTVHHLTSCSQRGDEVWVRLADDITDPDSVIAHLQGLLDGDIQRTVLRVYVQHATLGTLAEYYFGGCEIGSWGCDEDEIRDCAEGNGMVADVLDAARKRIAEIAEGMEDRGKAIARAAMHLDTMIGHAPLSFD